MNKNLDATFPTTKIDEFGKYHFLPYLGPYNQNISAGSVLSLFTEYTANSWKAILDILDYCKENK